MKHTKERRVGYSLEKFSIIHFRFFYYFSRFFDFNAVFRFFYWLFSQFVDSFSSIFRFFDFFRFFINACEYFSSELPLAKERAYRRILEEISFFAYILDVCYLKSSNIQFKNMSISFCRKTHFEAEYQLLFCFFLKRN